jgi:hypothetical protein
MFMGGGWGAQHLFFWVTIKVFGFFWEFKEKNRPILVRFWKKISTPQN